MKKILCPAILLTSLSIALIFQPRKCLAQNVALSDVVQLNEIPPQGILLDKAWKFQTGDNPDYAKPEFDDSKWQVINPTLDVHDLPQIKEGVVWFRLHLFLDTNLLKEQLALMIQQSGASEVYLNGSLIYSFGVFDTDSAKVKAYDPLGQPAVFPAKKDAQEIIAVRYALQPGVRYTAIFSWHNAVLRASINTMNVANRSYRQFIYFVLGANLFHAGIFFILTVLHLSFFLFYRSQKANLYFSLFALLSMMYELLGIFCNNIHWVEQKFYFANLTMDLLFIGYLPMVTAIYYLLAQKRGRWYSTSMILGVLSIIAIALPGSWGWYIGRLFFILINLEITCISFISVKRKKRGAWIMAGGSLGYLICMTAFMVAGHPGGLDVFTRIVFNLSWLSIPVATSIYLGLDFAFTSRSLQQKLTEVQKLSQKNMEQEREKQEILALQNVTLEKQVSERTAELKHSLENLKSTQAQLIQSEKMASLGELTAGIAHEIQNPLNFVNNFSDVNKELIEELRGERLKAEGERNTATEDEILDDIEQNLEKINQHGKRADAIVKGMLQHSRTSTGVKEPTDINKLAEEYLRLSYHGFRAKDKEFNVDIKTEFDKNIEKINAVPQDIGRVLLNLYNNAFYAVNERYKAKGVRLKAENSTMEGERSSYVPTVTVVTKKINDKIEIKVKDNGPGIPQNIVDKIFQPFFTTKPTGQGTGLGLSLSYDIIKAHGGEIKVNTKDSEGLSAEALAEAGSEFGIVLPV